MKYGLVGGTYGGANPRLCPQRTINLYPKTISAKGEPRRSALVQTPGKRLFGTLPTYPGRGIYAQNGRLFAVGGTTLYTVTSAGTPTSRGTVAGTNPVKFAGSGDRGNQIMLTGNGLGYIWNTNTSAFSAIGDPQFPAGAITCGYLDGYFTVTTADRFQISASLDGTAWGADVAQRIGAPEAIIGSYMDHEVFWLFGATQSEVWFDSGAASFPMEPIPGVFLETGLEAAYAVTSDGDALYWLGSDGNGGRQVFRNQGYNAVPISHEGVGAALTALTSVSDAQMWTYQVHNHTFVVLTVPSGDLTLQYDVTEQDWSELAYWNDTTATFEADRGLGHAYVFGKHLTLDRVTGAIWEITPNVYADGDAPLRWMRIGPVLSDENKTVFHHRAELDAVMGVGLSTGQGSDPTVMLRYSDDAGSTWSSELTASLGALGNYDARARWNGLGSSRRRVYEVSGTDPVSVSLYELNVEVSKGLH